MDSLRGRLLIAGPTLVDPNFHRTVVLVAEHSEEGALGIVLNRLSELEVAEAAPEIPTLVDADEQLFVGGPVAPEGVIVLAEFEDPSEAGLLAFEDVGFLSGEPPVGGTRRSRVFAGHAGWAPGQLDGEVAGEDWIVEPAQREDLFSDAPERLWATLLERKGGRYRLLARMPSDPNLN